MWIPLLIGELRSHEQHSMPPTPSKKGRIEKGTFPPRIHTVLPYIKLQFTPGPFPSLHFAPSVYFYVPVTLSSLVQLCTEYCYLMRLLPTLFFWSILVLLGQLFVCVSFGITHTHKRSGALSSIELNV